MVERIRVARIIARLNVGGPAIHVTQLAARLPKDRFETLLLAGNVAPGETEMQSVIDREGVAPTRIRGLGRALRPYDDTLAFAEIVRQLRAFRPHIVHTHTAKAGTLGRLAARACRVPIVVHTFHGHVFDGYFSPLVARAFVTIERTLARMSDKIVTVSPHQAAELCDIYRIAPRDKVQVIPLGFDLSRFDRIAARKGELRRELGLGNVPVVSTIGRLTGVKDHPLLLRAIALMRTPAVHLVEVGGGHLEAELRTLAAELGIATRVHFLGSRNDVDKILADTDVLALTSKNEGTPVAVIEALASGCATVAIDVGGVGDVLDRGRYGLLVKSREPSVFASALDDAILHPPSESERRAAQRSTRERYGVERLVTDIVALYESLLRSVPA